MLRTLKLVFRSRKFHGWPSQRSLHSAPIFRLLLKVAVNGTHQCDSHNFWGAPSSNEQRTNCCTIFGELRAPTNREPIAAGGARSVCCSKSSCDTSVGRHNVFEPVLIVDARVSLEPFGFKACWCLHLVKPRTHSSRFNLK